MPHDRDGLELRVGDTVMVPCKVKGVHTTEDYCNVDLETCIPMPPNDTPNHITLNTRQTIKETRVLGAVAPT